MNYIFEKNTDSSVVKEVLYDRAWKRLYLVLVRGRLYRYHDVPEQVVCDLLSAPSLGRYFSSYIVSYRSDALVDDDPDYVQAKSLAIVEGEDLITGKQPGVASLPTSGSNNASHSKPSELDGSRNSLVGCGLPFFFGPLSNPERYPLFVRRAQSTFRKVITDYVCPVGLAQGTAIERHRALIPFLPSESVNYVIQILSELDIVISVVRPRKSKDGDCRIDRARRVAYITISENINRYKFLCILLHEVSHALNHLQYSSHDVIWKSIYSCLLADFYFYFPEKYRSELQWMMAYSPAAIRSTNFYGKGILSGCVSEEPMCIYSDSIDRDAEQKEYPMAVQDYAIHAVMIMTRLFLGDGGENLVCHCAGKLARASIQSTIEARDDILPAELEIVNHNVWTGDAIRDENVLAAIKRLSDMLVRCWHLYNPLMPTHVRSFSQCYHGGNPWIDELLKLVFIK